MVVDGEEIGGLLKEWTVGCPDGRMDHRMVNGSNKGWMNGWENDLNHGRHVWIPEEGSSLVKERDTYNSHEEKKKINAKSCPWLSAQVN